MNIKTAIKKSIKGGWLPQSHTFFVGYPNEKPIPNADIGYIIKLDSLKKVYYVFYNIKTRRSLCDMQFTGERKYITLLDPKFWQALGKSNGSIQRSIHVNNGDRINGDTWRVNMLLFIDNLARGQDIETAFNEATK